MVSAMLQVESAINQVIPNLPPGTAFRVRRMDPTVFPVLAYSLTSDTHSLVELRDIALYQLRPLLSTVTGVARVGVQGGARAEYQVVVRSGPPGQLPSFPGGSGAGGFRGQCHQSRGTAGRPLQALSGGFRYPFP